MNNEYLTEESLGVFLNEYFKDGEWIHDKCFLGKSRPDYRNDRYMMIVEFDGYNHYTSTKRILSDNKKDDMYINNGYRVIHIPYFVQLSKDTVKNLFGVDVDIEQKYPHGFVDSKCVLPSDFCYMGITRFINDIRRFGFIKSDIVKSLDDKIEKLGNRDLVLPNVNELNLILMK